MHAASHDVYHGITVASVVILYMCVLVLSTLSLNTVIACVCIAYIVAEESRCDTLYIRRILNGWVYVQIVHSIYWCEQRIEKKHSLAIEAASLVSFIASFDTSSLIRHSKFNRTITLLPSDFNHVQHCTLRTQCSIRTLLPHEHLRYFGYKKKLNRDIK